MGYTTRFDGAFAIAPPLNAAQRDYLINFSEIERRAWPVEALADVPDPLREAVGLPLGEHGMFFLGSGGAPDVEPLDVPPTWPGGYCQWVPSADGARLAWDGGDKFYDYGEWLLFLIRNVLARWGRTLTGRVTWRGEHPAYRGALELLDSVLTAELPAPSDDADTQPRIGWIGAPEDKPAPLAWTIADD